VARYQAWYVWLILDVPDRRDHPVNGNRVALLSRQGHLVTKPEMPETGDVPERQWHTASFEPDPRSVREARQFVGSHVTRPDLRETGELLVSELTTNALRHGFGRFEVRVRAEPRVRVDVRDGSTVMPAPMDLNANHDSGRGLQIVSRLATAWGAEEVGQGKVVWFEL